MSRAVRFGNERCVSHFPIAQARRHTNPKSSLYVTIERPGLYAFYDKSAHKELNKTLGSTQNQLIRHEECLWF